MNPIESIQSQLSQDEAALVLSEANRFYLTHFPSSAGAVLITKTEAEFFVDFRYFEKAKQVVHTCSVSLCNRLLDEIALRCKNRNIQLLYVETKDMSVQRFQDWKNALDGISLSKSTLLDDKLAKLRMIKTPDELRWIEQAQSITDQTFRYICERLSAGRTERDVMLDMEFYLRRLGSEGVSFDFIVVSGKNSSLPHGVPTEKVIEKGDLVTMDFGAVINGYHSDMTRTVAVGAVDEEKKFVYQTVLHAQKEAMASIRPNASCKVIDQIARDSINNAGFSGCFGHGLGHSVGIEIHEMPCFNTQCETLLRPGMVMTVEPGIYLENRFGVRIEDMVVITENGYRNLTKSTKEWLEL